jgi:hypothetical protein
MNLIIGITEAITIETLTRWLDVRGILRLDTAMCKVQLRRAWLTLLCHPQLALPATATNAVVRWSSKTGLKFRQCAMSIHETSDRDRLINFVDASAAKLRCATISGQCSDGPVVRFVAQRATNLEDVTFVGMPLNFEDCVCIFSLKRIRRVAIRSSHVAFNNPVQFKGVFSTLTHVAFTETNINDEFVEALVRATPHVFATNLAKCCNLTDLAAASIAGSWKSLQWANFCATPFTEVGIETVARGCPSLSTIYLTPPEPAPVHAMSAPAIALAENSPQLQELYLSVVHCITTHCVGIIAQHCRSLRHIHLAVGRDTEEPIVTLVDGCQLLETVYLGVCGYLSMQSLEYMAAGWKGLRKLTLQPDSGVLPKALLRAALPLFRPGVEVSIQHEECYDEKGAFIKGACHRVHADRVLAESKLT